MIGKSPFNREYVSYYNPLLNLSGLTGNVDGQLLAAVSNGSLANATGTATQVGGCTFSTTTNAAGAAGVMTGASNLLFGGGRAMFETRFSFSNDPSTAEAYAAYLGFIDSISAAPTDGCYLIVDASSNAKRVRFIVSAASSTTAVDVSTFFTAATESVIRIEVNAAGTVARLYQNDILIAEIAVATNIPVTAGQEFGMGCSIIKSNGTTARTITARYLKFYKDKTTQA